MARKLRLEYAGACYHVINRGNYRRDLFGADATAESFRSCLFEAAARFGWRLHAFVIMRNHFHLAVETPEPNLSEGMRWLQGTWAIRFNRFRGVTGRPFQGRYKALHVEPGQALAQVAHYIHLNPLRAKAVSAEELPKFPWSSLVLFPQATRPDCLDSRTILKECGGLPDTPAGWRRYVAYLEVVAEEEVRLRDEKFGRLSRGWAIGSKGFKNDLKKDLIEQGGRGERFQLLGADRTAHAELYAEVWKQKLNALAKELRLRIEELPAKKSAGEKVMLAAAMKIGTSVSNGWLAERLSMGEPATVSQYVRRFRLGEGASKRAFLRLLSIIKE